MGKTLSKEDLPRDYDVECDIASICDISRDKGWNVTARAIPEVKDLTDKNKKWDHTICAVVGLYNKGKTTVLNLMAGTEFDATNTKRTKGLSFKLMKTETCKLILLDSAGMYSPVQFENAPKTAKPQSPREREEKLEIEKTEKIEKRSTESVPVVNSEDEKQKNDEHFASLIAEKKATEQFLQELIFEIADVLIVVVDNLTVLDQEYLQTMHMKISQNNNTKGKTAKHLFVLHNFRDSLTETEAQERWTEQVKNIYKTGKPETKNMTFKNRKMNSLQEVKVYFMDSPIARHLFIANKERYGATYNIASLELLKTWIEGTRASIGREALPLEMIESASNLLISAFMDNVQPIKKQEVDGRIWFQMIKQENDNMADAQLKPWKRDGFTIIFDPEKITNKFLPKCRILENDLRTRYIIYLDLPGCKKEDIIIQAKKNQIVIKGRRYKEVPADKANETFHEPQNECGHGEYESVFNIDSRYDCKPKTKSFVNGLLIIELREFATEEVGWGENMEK